MNPGVGGEQNKTYKLVPEYRCQLFNSETSCLVSAHRDFCSLTGRVLFSVLRGTLGCLTIAVQLRFVSAKWEGELELFLVCLLQSIYYIFSFLVPLKIKPRASHIQGKGRSHVVLALLILLLPPKYWQKLIKPAVWRLRQESIKFEVSLSYQVTQFQSKNDWE